MQARGRGEEPRNAEDGDADSLAKLAELASRLTSLATVRKLHTPPSLLLIEGSESFKWCMHGSDLGVHGMHSVAFLC